MTKRRISEEGKKMRNRNGDKRVDLKRKEARKEGTEWVAKEGRKGKREEREMVKTVRRKQCRESVKEKERKLKGERGKGNRGIGYRTGMKEGLNRNEDKYALGRKREKEEGKKLG